MSHRVLSSILVLLSLSLLASACEKERRVVRTRPPAVRERAKIPEPPDLRPPATVPRYPDGSYSVAGAQGELANLAGETIRVKGFVSEVSLCDPTEQDDCAHPPHAYLVDDRDRPRRPLLVVGSLRSPLGQFKAGEGETLEGTLLQVSPDGRFITARGLLLLPDPPPPEPEPEPESE